MFKNLLHKREVVEKSMTAKQQLLSEREQQMKSNVAKLPTSHDVFSSWIERSTICQHPQHQWMGGTLVLDS